MTRQRDSAVYRANSLARAQHARWRCEAAGFHHADCPRWGSRSDGFCIHHVQPREHDGSDDFSNLRYVWNGSTGLGLAGCHSRIHTERRDVYDDNGRLERRGSESAGLLHIPSHHHEETP